LKWPGGFIRWVFPEDDLVWFVQDLSLHILDIVENSLAAGARRVEIRIEEDLQKDRLTIEIMDDGCGMDEAMAKQALDPFFTTKTNGTGLGLSIVYQLVEKAGGGIEVGRSQTGIGTLFSLFFPPSPSFSLAK